MTLTPSTNADYSLFPPLRRVDVLACQTSAWYPEFERKTIKATVITDLGEDFRAYLESDGLIIPEGAEDRDTAGELSSDEEMESNPESDDEPMARFSFPRLDQQIRQAIISYSAVFPKLNWTAPKDAGWMLTSGGPLRCTSPADVYLLLKSSDFAMHDLDETRVFEGCIDGVNPGEPQPDGTGNSLIGGSSPGPGHTLPSLYERASPVRLELVLKKWYEVERSREVRCFVRDNRLLGISQRDPNLFEHLRPQEVQEQMRATVSTFWQREVKSKFAGGQTTSYVMDLLLTRDLSRAHIIDFNPYASRTDPLLFEWSELAELNNKAQETEIESGIRSLHLDVGGTREESATAEFLLPVVRIVTSPNQSARAMYSHNMIPADALSDNAMQFAAEIAVEMAQREREVQEREARASER